MNLEDFFSRDQVIKVKATEKQLVFKELIDKLFELGLIENKERFYAQIVHRESLENTGIGNGLAIPHARTESVEKFISILGICPEEIDYQAMDDKPVRYIMLSIFPADMSTQYLYLVGMMARIFSNDEKKEKLDSETAPKKIYTLLQRESRSYFDSISDRQSDEFKAPDDLTGVPSSDLDLLIRLDRLYHHHDEGNASESVKKKIEELKKLIDNRSLTYYERMRKKRSNPFAILERESCSGCHMGIPPYYHKQIRDGEGISVCTHCGRFLIIV